METLSPENRLTRVDLQFIQANLHLLLSASYPQHLDTSSNHFSCQLIGRWLAWRPSDWLLGPT